VAGELSLLFKKYSERAGELTAEWNSFSLEARTEILSENGVAEDSSVADFCTDSSDYVNQKVLLPVFKELSWL